MLSLLERGPRLNSGLSRREWLRVGGIGMLGLSLPQLLAAENIAQAAPPPPELARGLSGAMFGRAKNVIFLWLQGGPPQHETFDPKPEAPAEVRGAFRPIQTNVPGIQFCELLPRTARRADKLAIIRSLATDDNNHDVSGYWVLTGYPYGPGSARQIKQTDWPYFGSIVKMLRPSDRLPALTSVWLPDRMRLNDNVTPAGQTGGFLGSFWDPDRFIGDPARADYAVEGLSLPVDLPPERLGDRTALLARLNSRLRAIDLQGTAGSWNKLSQFALDLVTSGNAKQAFDLSREPAALRDRYGRHTWGQSCLLARRLVEAGVRLVHVNWPREPGDSAVDNPMWDTHAQNADRLQDVLCPLFDVTFSALLDDLESRGLLHETLVVAVGEFGRTPKINRLGGRDHWGSVFSCVLAGAGISGGQVFGSSDKQGAFPVDDPIRPHALTATIFHLLGIPHDGVFRDRTNRSLSVTKGEPLYRLLGDHPATTVRCESTGDERFCLSYDASLLADVDFADQRLFAVSPLTREKGWRANPLAANSPAGFAACLATQPVPHVRLGWLATAERHEKAPVSSQKIILAQEIKSARGGHYTFTVHAGGGGSSAETFARWFQGPLVCKLVLFRFSNTNKSALEVEELEAAPFQPTFLQPSDQPGEFTLSRFLGSTTPGANFPIGNGLGVAVVVESKSPLATAPGEFAYVQIHSVTLSFDPRPRDENVVV
jgi:Protein of unknown function (DUF1501)